MQAIHSIKVSPRYAAQSWIALAQTTRGSVGSAPATNGMAVCGPVSDRESALHCEGLNPRAMARTMAYIRDHLSDSVSLKDLAEAACISRFHFARQFRLATGLSPMEFVLKARVEAGREMLRRGEQKISTLAVSLGFFDQSHFTRAFRRVTGLAPGQFTRKIHGNRHASNRTAQGVDPRSAPFR